MKRTIAGLLGAVLVTTGVVVAGCSTAGADVAANPGIEQSEAQPCQVADTDSLQYLAAGGSLADRIAQPFVFDRVDCVGTTAIAYTMPDGVNAPVEVEFEYSVGSWRPIDVHPATAPASAGAGEIQRRTSDEP